MGAEKAGISDEIMEQADDFISMPIYGFTESFNVSVANGILLHELINRLRKSDVKWQISDEERNELMLDWTLKSIVSSHFLAEKFMRDSNWEIQFK